MKSLKPRLLTAVIGIPILLIVLFVSELWHPFVGIVIGAFSAFMTGEYLHARKMLYKFHLSIPCMLFTFLLSILVTTKYLYVLIFAFILTVFAVMIFKHEKTNYADVAYSVFGTFLISFGMSAVPIACASSVSITFCYICIFALPWMADAGGFFIGASLGKHKLCPKISPKKTVEGAIGGILFCDLTAVIIGLIFHFCVMPDANINFWALILLGVIDAPVSILGDLSFSLIKRNYGIKDYGSIFPGHGGMLDRFDSIIFTAPVLVAINQFIPFITVG